MKSDIITAASQELRAPLTGILGFAELLERRTDVSDEAVERASVIAAEASRLSRIGNDPLDAARLGSEHPTSPVTRVRVAEVAGAVSAFTVGLSSLHRVRVSGNEQLELTLKRGRLDQVLSSLVAHAIECSPEGGEISIALTGQHDAVRVDVSLEAGDSSTRPGSTGQRIRFGDPASLELALVKRMVGELGGRLSGAAETDGATLSIRLPLAPPTEGAALG